MTSKRYFPITALLLLTALNLLNYMDRSVLSAVQAQIQDEFHRSHEDIGFVTTAFFWVYMLAAPAIGPLADRFSRKWIVVAGGVLWSLATLLTAVTHSYSTLLFRHAIVGIGEVHGWRAPFYLAGAPGILLALAIAFLPEPPRGIQDSIPETPERKSIAGLVRNKAFWTATLGMAFMTFALGGIAVWMPTFLVRERGYSVSAAGTMFGLILAFDGVVASLLGGWIGDKLLPRFQGAYYLVSAISLALGVP